MLPIDQPGQKAATGANLGLVLWGLLEGQRVAAARSWSWMSDSSRLKKKLQGTPRKKGASTEVKGERDWKQWPSP